MIEHQIEYNKKKIREGMRIILTETTSSYFEHTIFKVVSVCDEGVYGIFDNFNGLKSNSKKPIALRWDQFEIIQTRGFEIVDKKFRKHPNVDIQLPKRGSFKSAGYDICTPVDITIPPYGISDAIQTDIKAYMLDDEVLQIVPRSSIGFKKGLMLINTIGIIDSDYYNNKDNDGNIGFKLKNLTGKEVTIKAGERIMQGIFVKYLITDDDECDNERTGGIGSTGV